MAGPPPCPSDLPDARRQLIEPVLTAWRARRQVRQAEGRNPEASACVIDAQSVKTSTNVPATGQGTDAAKKIVGRKRSIATDTLGLLLAVLVTATDVQDSVAGTPLLNQLATGQSLDRWRPPHALHRPCRHPRHRCPGRVPRPRHSRIHRPASPVGRRAHLRPLTHHRRLARDYETLPTASEAVQTGKLALAVAVEQIGDHLPNPAATSANVSPLRRWTRTGMACCPGLSRRQSDPIALRRRRISPAT